MKKRIAIFSIFGIILFSCLSFVIHYHSVEKIKNVRPATGFAVVELFTSEGCSSCPAADAILEKIVKEYKSNVYMLGFHMDYWNRLGWKDAFSNEDYTKRQRQYATQFNLNGIYTPQVVVNGKSEFVGSDESKLRQTIQQELNMPMASVISIEAKNNGSKKVDVSYKVKGAEGSLLNIALVQLEASTAVKRGENEGKQLHHVNIVRDIKTVSGGDGTVKLSIPSGMSATDFKIIAFTQNKNDLKITGASECGVQ
jgi:hypothetical protein